MIELVFYTEVVEFLWGEGEEKGEYKGRFSNRALQVQGDYQTKSWIPAFAGMTLLLHKSNKLSGGQTS